MSLTSPCPCGRLQQKRVLNFAKCCARYLDHFHTVAAPDAESLMRSRYSAFVLEREDYLKATWAEQQRPESVDFDRATKWLGLEIKACRDLDAHHAEVEFVARSRLHGQANRLHEISRFVMTDGRGFYVDGTMCQFKMNTGAAA